MPPPAVFAIGVLLDLLGYLPLGVGVLTLLVTHGIALRLRRFLGQQGFAVTWLAFLPVAAGAAHTAVLLASGVVVVLGGPGRGGGERELE